MKKNGTHSAGFRIIDLTLWINLNVKHGVSKCTAGMKTY
jgi:hypothetical protein